MIAQALAFFIGVLLFQSVTNLPNGWVVIFLVFFTLGLFVYAWISNNIFIKLFLLPCLIGLIWTLYLAEHHVCLPKTEEGKTINITGYIASLPNQTRYATSFLFETNQPHQLIKLSWSKNKIILNPGDEWQFTVRLKRIHGNLNPGGFDYEAWAYQAGLSAAGYIVTQGNNHLIASHWYHHPLDRIRYQLKITLEKILSQTNTSPWIEALIIGERQNLSEKDWEILRNTGTNHLMAIAGLHIGFMAALIHKIVSFAWRRHAVLPLLLPASEASAIAALVMAFLYSALAGFSLPTERALIMFSAYLVIVLLRRKVMPWQIWCMALLFILTLNPFSVLTDSFWLSLGSVALIIYGMSGDQVLPHWKKYLKIQYVITIGLIPFSIWLFQQLSWVSFLANMVAIPYVGFIILPLLLMGCLSLIFSDKVGSLILIFANKLFGLLWFFLSELSHFSFAAWHGVMPNYFILTVSLMGVIVLLSPLKHRGKYLGVLCLLPVFLYTPSHPKLNEAWLTVLDVGQGLSAVIQTEHHVLVFDAGPRLSDRMDMGESVVTSFLHTLKIKVIDMLVVSHGDNDHIGGSGALIKNFKVNTIKTSVPEKFLPYPALLCLQGDSWQWEGVQFEFIYPTRDNLGLDNDSSCVLKVTIGKNSILLPGDIEKKGEKNLPLSLLASTVLIAPHHGSKTSSPDFFVENVHPQYVLYGVGYRNRYHFPNPGVVSAYQSIGAKQFSTDDSGAIQLQMSEQGVTDVSRYREKVRRYWTE